MQDRLEMLRNIDSIIIPSEFTYFHHSTTYIPLDIKNKLTNGKYMRNWSTLPTEEFTVKREMSFVERDNRIRSTLEYRQPLSDTRLTYNLPDFSKPFCIRVVMPKIEKIRKKEIITTDEYRKEMELIYRGYGDGRHPKLRNGEKIYIIGTTTTDEVSGKTIDIFYGVRECDIDLYFECVVKAITEGYTTETNANLDTLDEWGRPINYYPTNYAIRKANNMERYTGEHSLFEQELLEDYKDDLDITSDVIEPIKDHHKYYTLYENYEGKKVIK